MNKASIRTSTCTLLFYVISLLSGHIGPACAQSAALYKDTYPVPPNFTNLHNNFDPYTPLFTPYTIKQKITAESYFTSLLLSNAQRYIPWITIPNTQAHLGFWSGDGNRGNLVRLLGSINFISPTDTCTTGPSTNCAIWDEGAVESEQYPLYVEMLEEHWYDRGLATGPTVSIYGVTYPNLNPLSFAQADQIWGQYSQRYADMAVELSLQTGKPVNAWCFLGGAKRNRIFFTYEYPELQKLEAGGYVTVHCTYNPDANWQNPSDWSVGTSSQFCLPPPPTEVIPPAEVTVFNRN
jgi:hypothetical protein